MSDGGQQLERRRPVERELRRVEAGDHRSEPGVDRSPFGARLGGVPDQRPDDHQPADRTGDLQAAAELRYGKLPELERSLERLQDDLIELQSNLRMLKEEVDEEDVAEVVSRWTGVPVEDLINAGNLGLTFRIPVGSGTWDFFARGDGTYTGSSWNWVTCS